jgi:LCP family protein required for cell wall assembly
MPKKILSFMLLFVLLFCAAIPEASAQKTSITPLLDPQKVKITQTQDEFLNILLLGLDLSTGVHHASGNKRNLMDAHTDVVMLVCINKTKGRIDLLSIPRDTLVYVPEVHGIYKLNAAFNTATNEREGFRHTTNTVSWLLGGVKIDAYCAVDMAAMYTMVDIIGGVDFDLEMNYVGTSGTKYKAGFQHLDAMGVGDYVRARTNATVDRNAMGRTARNRRMIIAIFDKLKGDMNMLNELWAVKDRKDVLFFTDMKGLYGITDMWDFLQTIDSAQIGSYMISGDYHLYVLGKYNANITDQKQRIETVKTIFGFEPDEIPFVSEEFCTWFRQPNGGCLYTQNIRQARLILDYALTLTMPLPKNSGARSCSKI